MRGGEGGTWGSGEPDTSRVVEGRRAVKVGYKGYKGYKGCGLKFKFKAKGEPDTRRGVFGGLSVGYVRWEEKPERGCLWVNGCTDTSSRLQSALFGSSEAFKSTLMKL